MPGGGGAQGGGIVNDRQQLLTAYKAALRGRYKRKNGRKAQGTGRCVWIGVWWWSM